jgi:short-subunit dehydrogenase involved in D-alanine esterification of teichoic acids
MSVPQWLANRQTVLITGGGTGLGKSEYIEKAEAKS